MDVTHRRQAGLLIALLFAFCQFTNAQGFEKQLILPGVDLFDESIHLLLPNNNKLIANENALMVIDDRAEVVWNVELADEFPIIDLAYRANGDTLLVYAFSDVPLQNNAFLIEYQFNSAGALIGEQSVQVGISSALSRFKPKFSQLVVDDAGQIGLFLSYYDNPSGGASIAEDANQIQFRELSSAGTLGEVKIISVGEFCYPLAADRLADGSFALQLQVDTTFDDNNTLDNAFAAIFHYYPTEDSLVRVSEYANVAIGQTGFSRIAPGRYAVGAASFSDREVNIYDLNGDSLWQKFVLEEYPFFASYRFEGLFRDTSGGYYLFEEYHNPNGDFEEGLLLTQLSETGDSLRSFIAQNVVNSYYPQDIYGLDNEQRPYIAGTIPGLSIGTQSLTYLYIQLDSSLQGFTNLIEGSVYPELMDGNCSPDTSSEPFINWWVVAAPDDELRDTLYAFTDATGSYNIRCDSGTYEVYAVPPNNYFGACSPVSVNLAAANDTVQQLLAGQILYDCSLPVIQLSSTPFSGCEPGYYLVQYTNQGAVTEPNGRVTVTLDTFFVPTGASPPWDEQNGNQLIFELDTLPPNGFGQIRIDGFMDCGQALPGQSHCTTARIEPDTFCTPVNPLWDGSSIEVAASCTNDTVFFTIQNVGQDMAEPLNYIIIEDFVIHLGGDFELPSLASEIISFAANEGATYQIQAEQAANHPGSSMPTAGIEGCGNFDPDDFTLGLLAQFAQDEGDPFVAIHCQASVVGDDLSNLGEDLGYRSSKDETTAEAIDLPESSDADQLNRSHVFISPAGIGPRNLVDTAATIDFTIAFRSSPLGPEDLHQITIDGELPATFDLTSLRPGPASHPFTFTVSPSGAFRFSLQSSEAISIPEAFAGWGGFVQFSARLKAEVAAGTESCFSATASFNNQPAETTNQRCITIRKPVRYGIREIQDCQPGLDTVLLDRAIDSIPSATFDSIVLTITTTAGTLTYDSFPTAMNGDTIAGIIIDISDGRLIIRDTLQSAQGCDSVVIYNITVTDLLEYDPVNTIRLFPNPATDWLGISFGNQQENLGPLVLTDLVDISGRSYSIETGNSSVSGSEEVLILNVRNIPTGLYILRGYLGHRHWSAKVMIR